MGRFHVEFACHSCGHCCTDVICLPTPWDVIRIVKNTGKDPYRFLEFVTPDELYDVPLSDPTWLDIDGVPHMMALRRDLKGCYFLNKTTKKCGIYEHRPLLCRLYPFKLHESRAGEFKGFSLHADVGCPKNRDGLVPTQPLYDIWLTDKGHQEDYNALVDAFNRRQYKGKKPEHFIEMFITIKGRTPKLPAYTNA